MCEWTVCRAQALGSNLGSNLARARLQSAGSSARRRGAPAPRRRRDMSLALWCVRAIGAAGAREERRVSTRALTMQPVLAAAVLQQTDPHSRRSGLRAPAGRCRGCPGWRCPTRGRAARWRRARQNRRGPGLRMCLGRRDTRLPKGACTSARSSTTFTDSEHALTHASLANLVMLQDEQRAAGRRFMEGVPEHPAR